MKNVSSLNSKNKIDSPKTPGGISKSLLTPCRRLGLSRNWRKSGPSPFVSPLASNTDVRVDKNEDVPKKRDPRKRKDRCEDEPDAECSIASISRQTSLDDENNDLHSLKSSKSDELETTPSRNVSNPRRKKSKTILPSQLEDEGNIEVETQKPKACTNDNFKSVNTEELINDKPDINILNVDTPVRSKSKSKVKSIVERDYAKAKENVSENVNKNAKEKVKAIIEPIHMNTEEISKPQSPDKLTKECIVVIQKKLYKKDLDKLKQKTSNDKKLNNVVNPVSQALFDSDSDDVPLCTLNSKDAKFIPKLDPLDDDDDFAENTKVKVKKLADKTTSIGGLISDTSKKKTKLKKEILTTKSKPKIPEIIVVDSKPSSQSSIDDDDDFVMDRKKTIIIRKCYDKVAKPSKAKSTGSITQRDIDELKARIEVKKKLLLAKAVTEDTEELRDLIKKWQKGCQDALMELMELMKSKFPDKQNMDYSEMLQTLKIPASLVGYDQEHECFGTPTDENIILSKFSDS